MALDLTLCARAIRFLPLKLHPAAYYLPNHIMWYPDTVRKFNQWVR